MQTDQEVTPPGLVPAELLDAITEAMLAGQSSEGRARVAAAVVQELAASVAWITSADPSSPELAGYQAVVDAAFAHKARMRATVEDATGVL